ncbi:DUF6624 domain-containing protein [Spirosoma sp. KUDC1026]|uniref:DUF6624 domain-containing protein n=1 Tax=Spirosoma sp. KUDC1026 TaxID=2745947 RepID=UPI00159BE9C7|nr:DUF6624 domain-containing protein [Spirosoma sp. KUDC1026]QKZ14645.1 hypothetical protein HU175_19245 [Spirosoma sp. KUDC1026]
MYTLDQRYREYMARFDEEKPLRDSLAAVLKVEQSNLMNALWAQQSKIDASNLARTEAILKQYGYPGKKLVGEPTNEAVFYIIQHSDKIDTYLPQVKQAAEHGELPFRLYAMMLDRSLMHQYKPQIYGTQASCRTLQHEAKQQCFVWPIADYDDVNTLRKKAGFTQTVEEYAQQLRAIYERTTVEAVKRKYRF